MSMINLYCLVDNITVIVALYPDSVRTEPIRSSLCIVHYTNVHSCLHDYVGSMLCAIKNVCVARSMMNVHGST